MKNLDEKRLIKFFPNCHIADIDKIREANKKVEELIRYGESCKKTMPPWLPAPCFPGPHDPRGKKAINQYAQDMIKVSERAEKKILRDFPWMIHMLPEKRYQ